jgi:hypothetical protein
MLEKIGHIKEKNRSGAMGINYSYCKTHNAYPKDGEPCWQCANPIILKHVDTALREQREGIAERLEKIADKMITDHMRDLINNIVKFIYEYGQGGGGEDG